MKRKIKLNFMKKNQVVVAVTGLMLIVAGYLNYTNNEHTNSYIEVGSLADSMDMAEIGDAKLANSLFILSCVGLSFCFRLFVSVHFS